MKRYETYKDSGIEWLGDIPEHWKVCRTKNIVSLINDRASNPTLKKVALENIESATGRFIETDSVFEGEGIEFHEDDILFGKLRPYLAKVYKADFEGQSVGDIYVFRAKDGYVPDFLKYLFISDMFISVVDGSTYGAKMPRANWDFISDLRLALPDIEEQKQIANYLDSKVGQIDDLISAKERLVEDLQLYSTSVISETVTRGLHPDVEMNESGVEWLGKIPSSWKVTKVAWLFYDIGSGTTPNTNNSDYYTANGINWLQTGDLTDGEIHSTSKTVTSKAVEECNMRVYPHQSVVIAMYGATIAKLGFLQIETTTNQACCVIPPTIGMESKFVFYAFYASKTILINKSYGGGQPNISQALIKEHKLPVPPLSEQQEIADYLDEKTAKIDASIKELKTQIEDLRKYKTSIINEAVTGKIDLRDWKLN